MKQQFILKILGIVLFMSAISCATRSSPPAPVVSANQVPAYAEATAAPKPAAPAAAATAPTKPKLEAVSNSDDEVQTTPTNKSSTRTVVAKPAADDSSSTSGWQMPTEGTMGAYSSAKKGVNITGNAGQPIYAVAAGKVIYSGNGLKGYGNLIIISHDNGYLSAYGHNKANLVTMNTMVKQGQKIATMGMDENQAVLHFEVRKNGKPLDPHTMIGN